MREIKFRAWDDVRNKMYFWDGTGLGQAIPHWIDKKTPIMQFTGLRDKNGKEIFEGDIVYCEVERGKWKNKGKAVITWDMLMFNVERLDEGLTEEYESLGNFEDDESYKIEVIGNIYENPELLEGEK